MYSVKLITRVLIAFGFNETKVALNTFFSLPSKLQGVTFVGNN
jgi:hypothetical protein